MVHLNQNCPLLGLFLVHLNQLGHAQQLRDQLPIRPQFPECLPEDSLPSVPLPLLALPGGLCAIAHRERTSAASKPAPVCRRHGQKGLSKKAVQGPVFVKTWFYTSPTLLRPQCSCQDGPCQCCHVWPTAQVLDKSFSHRQRVHRRCAVSAQDVAVDTA